MNLLGLVLLAAHAISAHAGYRHLPTMSGDFNSILVLNTDDHGSNVKEWCKYHANAKDPYWCFYASYSVGEKPAGSAK